MTDRLTNICDCRVAFATENENLVDVDKNGGDDDVGGDGRHDS